MGGRVQRVPGVPGHEHALRRVLAERVDVLRLAEQDAHDELFLVTREEPERPRLLHERDPVAPEERGEHGLGTRRHELVDLVDVLTGAQLRERRRHIGDRGLELLEPGPEALPGLVSVLVVGPDVRPLDVGELGRPLGQETTLLPGVRAHPEDVAVALLPGERVGQGLRGEEEDLLLQGEVGHGEPDRGGEGPHEELDPLLEHQLLRVLDPLVRPELVVAEEHLDLPPEETALLVDLLQRHLDGGAVGRGEGRPRSRVGVDVPDLDRRLRPGRPDEAEREGETDDPHARRGRDHHAILLWMGETRRSGTSAPS